MLYAANEKVLCFHGPLIYQAKVSHAPSRKARPPYSRTWIAEKVASLSCPSSLFATESNRS
jgi:hypothetical protein